MSFVTGASGFVGSRLVGELLDRGHSVTAMVRAGASVSALRAAARGREVTLVGGDLRRFESIRGHLGADYVFHLGATLMGVTEAQFYSTNVTGTANLLKALAKGGRPLKRFILVSSLAAAGPSRTGLPLDERVLPSPISCYGRSKLQAEEIARSFHSANLPVTIVRPAGILGVGSRDVVELVLRLANLRVALQLAESPERLSLIHVNDTVGAILSASTSPRTLGKIYFLSADPPVQTNQILSGAARLTGRRPFVTLTIGARSQYVMAVMAETVSALFQTRPLLTRDKWRELRGADWICTSASAKKDFNWEASITLEDSLTDIRDGLKNNLHRTVRGVSA
jgi:dihydroflavonol-4-reductase